MNRVVFFSFVVGLDSTLRGDLVALDFDDGGPGQVGF